MIDTIDIQERIIADFGDKAQDAFTILDQAISKADYLNQNRIIRCIIHLSDKDLNKLKKNIDAAIADPRDVILWSEYENFGQAETPKRIKDFNNPFGQAVIKE